MWWNGRHGGLKIHFWQQSAGSSPAIGTKTERARAVHVAARKLAHLVRKCYYTFAYGTIIKYAQLTQGGYPRSQSRGLVLLSRFFI